MTIHKQKQHLRLIYLEHFTWIRNRKNSVLMLIASLSRTIIDWITNIVMCIEKSTSDVLKPHEMSRCGRFQAAGPWKLNEMDLFLLNVSAFHYMAQLPKSGSLFL